MATNDRTCKNIMCTCGKMFGFGLKLKSKPKPTISAARRPRDPVAESSHNLIKQTSNEHLNQNSSKDKSILIQPERSTSTVVKEITELVSHTALGHLESGNEDINEESYLNKDTVNLSLVNSSKGVIENDRTFSHPTSNHNSDSSKTCKQSISSDLVSTGKYIDSAADNASDETSTSHRNLVISKDNSEITKQDSNCQKNVPFIPKLLPKKNKFVPNLRAVRKTDVQSDNSPLISPKKNTGPVNNNADNSPDIAAKIESHVDSVDKISKASEMLSEVPKTAIKDEIRNQSAINEQQREPPPVLTIQPPKEPLSSSKPNAQQSADKENTICNDEGQANNPSHILQNSKKKKPRAQGTFLQMTIEAKKELNEKLKDGKLDKSKLIMRDLILYNPSSNPMPVKPRTKGIKEEHRCKTEMKSLQEEILCEQSVDDVEATRDSMPVPQLKVGPDGKIILDSSSLVIETTGTEKSRTDIQNSELVEENEFSGFKYRKRRARRNEWSAEETVLFYKALNDLGADFSLMQTLFPGRTRRDLKLKFKKEEKCNLSLVDKAMTHVGKFNFEALKEELERDRAERIEKQKEETRLREEAKKIIKIQKMEAKKKNLLLKLEKLRKKKEEDLKNSSNKAEQKNSSKCVIRNKKMLTNKGIKRKKIPKNEMNSESDSDNPSLSSDDKIESRSNNIDNFHYNAILKTTKSGRCPRIRNKYQEECEENEIEKPRKKRKTSDNRMEDEQLEKACEIELNLFEDPPYPEETSTSQEATVEFNEENDSGTYILNISTRVPAQNLPETIRIVEELTSDMSHCGTVDVNGLQCKIIAVNEGSEFDSSTFQVRDCHAENSNCSIRFDSVNDGAKTGSQVLNYVISYDANTGEDIQLSQIATDGETNLHSDHSYCFSKSPQFITPHIECDENDYDDESSSQMERRSLIVLKPNECVEIYNDS
ncbi:transcription factor TFIIIB component B'' isoform X2 [Nilaparvata lugens]|uniref:transcription factor TFIIIB component B'' isoform X2 n=1 Tax=Nilaparvata lugens TaxID=108931 RepID=UPI00193E22B8|nr:transcription factor TFIIIB component B'' isoform X2 [Nilaparvata lugens]